MEKRLEYAEISDEDPQNAFAEVLHAGYEKCIPEHYCSIERNHYLLHLVLGGQGVLRIDDNVYRLRSHQCFLIRPNSDHAYQADSSNPWEYLWMGFTGVTDQVLMDIYGIPIDAAAFSPASPARLEYHLRRILSAMQSSDPFEQLFSRAMAVLALGCLGEHGNPEENRSLQADYIQEAASYIESKYASLKNVQSVADYVGLERSYFSKLFQDRTGISAAHFIAETRMSHAKRLLADTDYKISEISKMVGYDNYQSFERRFASIVQMSPSEFRKRPAGQQIMAKRQLSPMKRSPLSAAATIAPEPAPQEQKERSSEKLDANSFFSGSRGCPAYIRRKKS